MRRFRIWWLVGLLLACSFTHATTPLPPPDETDAQAARALASMVTNPELAYSSRIRDNAFLLTVIDRYMDTLDPSRLVFTQQDEEKFKRDPRWVPAAMQGRALAAPLRIFEVYRDRFAAAMEKAQETVDSPPDMQKNAGVWVVDRSTAPRPSSQQQWNQMWAKSALNDLLELQASGRTLEQAREDLSSRYQKAVEVVNGFDKDRVLDLFLDAYARSFDPHSNYLPPTKAEGFAIALSLHMDGVGMELSREDTGIVIKNVTKDGPAYKAGIRPGDRLTAFGDADGMKPVDGLPLSDIVHDIRGPKGTVVDLEINKKDTGVVQRLSVTRATIQLAKQKASWKMISIQDQDVAVVSLPIFYHDFKDVKGNSAAKDIAFALSEAKAQGAQGVVLDLMGNGGGSLVEAIDVVGLFAPSSVVVQVRQSSGHLSALASSQKQPAWSGPLVVLVDRHSASASEIVAGALQDLKRAVIVGERTYGKGTVQTLINLDRAAASPQGGLGQVKLTTAQFFRPSGISTQLIGVRPDVVLGRTEDAVGERSYSNALPAAKVQSALDSVPPEIDNLSAMQTASKQRHVVDIIESPPRVLPLDLAARKHLHKSLADQYHQSMIRRRGWVDEAARVVADQAISISP